MCCIVLNVDRDVRRLRWEELEEVGEGWWEKDGEVWDEEKWGEGVRELGWVRGGDWVEVMGMGELEKVGVEVMEVVRGGGGVGGGKGGGIVRRIGKIKKEG